MKVTINNETFTYNDGTSLETISKDFFGQYVCAKVNNRIRELSFNLNFDANVEFLNLENNQAMNIYQATLRYVVAMALNNLRKKENIRFSNSISYSFFAKIIGKSISKNELLELEEEVNRIIKADYKFERKKYTIEEMTKYYEDLGYYDKIENLKYRKELVNVYECNGYRNYMYSYMLPSTGYIKNYKFILYYPGFIIQFPRVESKGEIPKFNDEPVFLKTLADANKWAALTGSENIYEINKKAEDYDELVRFINVCETRHYHQLQEIGERIEKNISDIRLIAIAGPSSSGKTTFSKRLEIELLSRNIHPLRISLDNYYLDQEDCPKDEKGNPDFEHIESLNLDLFNENMSAFLNGEEVRLPIYDFTTHTRSFTEPIKLKKDEVIIIEGIHALNEILTSSISKENKFKIYICPLTQRNIDNHNPMSLTSIRLVRRIVRDKNFRNTDALHTLLSWDSVRKGERTWIYPHMESADYIFNSELGYELLVLKKYGIDSLKEISNDSSQYVQANATIKYLKIFRSIGDEQIPNNSLIREFIGGSVFKDI